VAERQRGSVTVLVAGVLMAAVPATVAVGGLADIALARTRAQSDAQAALAAASGPGGCPAAAGAVAVAGGVLAACGRPGSGAARPVVVTVVVTLPRWLGPFGAGTAVATARGPGLRLS
jgi:hypothetical protein